jgi:hypothetical protein
MSDKRLGLFALLWLLACVTIALQSWVGDSTIYSRELEGRREQFHYGVLENKPPGGDSWSAVGAKSIQKRVGIVYLAEGLRQLSHLPIGKIYKLLDSCFLFVSLVGLFFLLRKWLADVYCLVGVLYVCAMLPLSYLHQLFHPWDRAQLALWIGLLYLLVERRFVLLALGLALSVTVKFDTLLLPLLYLGVHRDGKHAAVRVWLETALLFAIVLGMNALMDRLFPDTQAASRFSLAALGAMLAANAHKAVEQNLRYPPLLVHALPALLALKGLASKGRYAIAATGFGLLLCGVFAALTNFEEVRAQMMVTVLLLPAALMTVERLLGGRPRAAEYAPLHRTP